MTGLPNKNVICFKSFKDRKAAKKAAQPITEKEIQQALAYRRVAQQVIKEIMTAKPCLSFTDYIENRNKAK